MHVGTCTVRLHLGGIRSLKGKRRIIHSLVDRLHRRFNVSVAEVDDLNRHQHAVLGIACVSNDRAHVDRVVAGVIRYIEQNGDVVLVDVTVETW